MLVRLAFVVYGAIFTTIKALLEAYYFTYKHSRRKKAIRHVLLVDDDPNDARLTVRFLSRQEQPVKVEVVDTLERAQDFLMSQGEFSGNPVPDVSLILLDHHLPGRSGIELLSFLRNEKGLQSIPVVMLTGNSDSNVVRKAIEAGANSCVLKPLDPTDFEQTIASVAAFWLSSNLIAPRLDRALVL